MNDSRHLGPRTVARIPLVTFKGSLINESPFDVLYEIDAGGNKFRYFFPKTMIWLNDDSIDVHRWLCERMGLV